MKFWKMEAAGNDFVIFDGRNLKIQDWNCFAKKLCDRHFGVGADGILFYEESKVADFKMNYYNSDGSRGEMCGNGIRCLSRYAYEMGFVKKKEFTIETDAGIKNILLDCDEEGKVALIKVEMGQAEWETEFQEETILFEEGRSFSFYRTKVGVPHIILFVENFMEDGELNYWGKKLEHHSAFPKKTNVNFIRQMTENQVEIRTWERGAGRTLGCATGCSSAGAVMKRLGKMKGRTEFQTEGGSVFVEVKENFITIYGKANRSFEGEIDE